MPTKLIIFFFVLLLCGGCMEVYGNLSPSDVKEKAVAHYQLNNIPKIVDTSCVGAILVNTGLEDQWYIAYNKVQTQPALLLYHISKPKEPPHYIPLLGKSECIIEHVDFENVTNDDQQELVIELHYDYDLSFQGREVVILRNPFGNPAYEVFSFPFEQVWETIDSFDNIYGLPAHSKRIENHATYDFFEGFIMIKGIINYRKHHLLEYKWDKLEEEFVLVLDEEHHEAEEEEGHGIVHKTKGTKMLVEVSAHEDNCIAYLLEDTRGHVIDIAPHIHDELLCSQVTGLSADGRHLIYTDNNLNAICVYDIEKRQNEVLLKKFDTYEGVSEVAWAPGRPFRFAFITVNHEELLENTRIHLFTFDKERRLSEKVIDTKVHYDCNLEGICVPAKDYHYRFGKNNRFLFKEKEGEKWKAIKLD